jgi:hypothetical protein
MDSRFVPFQPSKNEGNGSEDNTNTSSQSHQTAPTIQGTTGPVVMNDVQSPAMTALRASAPPTQPSAPTVPMGPPITAQPKKRNKALIVALIVGAVLVLGGGSAAAYFGYYVPNKPENIWKKALVNSGKGYDKLTNYAVNTKSQGMDLQGSFKMKGAVVADGTFKGNSYGDDGQLTSNISAGGVKLGIDIRTLKSTGDTPDFYFRVNGLQGLGNLLGGDNPQVASLLNVVNNQWYVVDHTLFEQLGQSTNADTQISRSDVSAFLKAVGDPTKQYVFTGDTTKQVVVVKQNVGKEKQGNRTVYHYKVGVNKENLQAYINAVCTNIKTNKIGKLLTESGSAQGGANACDELKKSAGDINPSDTADAWVDMRTKLVHDIRFTEKGNANNYVDIGQDYQGGTTFPFMLAAHSKTSDGMVSNFGTNVTLDTKTNKVTVKGQVATTGSSKDQNETGSFDLALVPSNKPVKVEKPAGAKTLIELLNNLGLGQLVEGMQPQAANSSTSSLLVQATARDTERQADINSLRSHIEAFYASNGYYPSLADVNNAAWRSQNMKGLDPAALKDPQGSVSTLAAAPAAKVYAYQPLSDSKKACDNKTTPCSIYTLTATLESGSAYTKASL